MRKTHEGQQNGMPEEKEIQGECVLKPVLLVLMTEQSRFTTVATELGVSGIDDRSWLPPI